MARTTLNHNRLLLRMAGMDGLKTGFTNAAGFNLAASAVRDGRRLITVVLGGSSSAARNENVETLLQAGFDVMDRRAHGQTLTLASLLSEPEDGGGAIMRPPLEMGSGEQAGLQVVTADAAPPRTSARCNSHASMRRRPPPVSPRRRASPPLAPWRPARSEELCETVTVRHRRRAVAEERCRRVTPAQLAAAAPDCRHEHGSRLRACRAEAHEMREVAHAEPAVSSEDCNHLRGRRLKACRVEAKADVQVALAEPAGVAPACAKAHGRRARAACRAEASSVARADAPAKSEGGGYLIQVGAFGSRSDAQAHLAKLSRAGLAGGGSETVESAGHAYRARFAGLSKADAHATCARLSARGERCMVVAR